ncbi:MAG: methylase protein [Sphingobacterium sp.]|jgi:site-specific DNA-methyltransferase (cytosine-N4-specific)|nr:methylase protein [Sphingobacterium sp.]
MQRIYNEDSPLFFQTNLGKLYIGQCEDIISNQLLHKLEGQVQLIFTSPPFPLNRKKKYDNLNGEEYIMWLESLAPLFKNLLTETGSVVIEMGNAWERGSPVCSLLPLEALIRFKQAGSFYLCQEFVYYNPARLPAPIEWVNKKRIRVKDAFTKLWWFAKSNNPYADNRNVLVEYSERMKRLLNKSQYNSGKRPSEYVIGEKSFLTNNGGAIPSNVIVASNTSSRDPYLKYCRKNSLELHPARMPREIPQFFINFLTKPGDIVIDPFAGSNTTGAVAEKYQRQWISIEAEEKYASGSIGRFQ